MARLLVPRRMTVVLILTVLLAPTAAWAKPGPRMAREHGRAASSIDFRAELRHLLLQFLSKEGCSIDPDGGKVAIGSPFLNANQAADVGCSIDPDGRCKSGH